MTIVNTDGLALVGPGSEALWLMGQFAVLAITGIFVFRQLRAQRSAHRVQTLAQLTDEWESERMVRHRLAAAMHLAEGRPGFAPALFTVGTFFERIGQLAEHGDVRPEDLWAGWSWSTQLWWQRYEAQIREARAANPGLWRAWEALSARMAELDRRRGTVVDERVRQAILTSSVPVLIERLRIENEAKNGGLPVWPPAAKAPKPRAPRRSADQPLHRVPAAGAGHPVSSRG